MLCTWLRKVLDGTVVTSIGSVVKPIIHFLDRTSSPRRARELAYDELGGDWIRELQAKYGPEMEDEGPR